MFLHFASFSNDGCLTLVVVIDSAVEENLKDTETIKSAIAEAIRGDETFSSMHNDSDYTSNETLVRRTYARIGLRTHRINISVKPSRCRLRISSPKPF